MIFFISPCIRRPRYGRPRRNIEIPFGMEKMSGGATDGEKTRDKTGNSKIGLITYTFLAQIIISQQRN